jgi:hypothetical protein
MKEFTNVKRLENGRNIYIFNCIGVLTKDERHTEIAIPVYYRNGVHTIGEKLRVNDNGSKWVQFVTDERGLAPELSNSGYIRLEIGYVIALASSLKEISYRGKKQLKKYKFYRIVEFGRGKNKNPVVKCHVLYDNTMMRNVPKSERTVINRIIKTADTKLFLENKGTVFANPWQTWYDNKPGKNDNRFKYVQGYQFPSKEEKVYDNEIELSRDIIKAYSDAFNKIRENIKEEGSPVVVQIFHIKKNKKKVLDINMEELTSIRRSLSKKSKKEVKDNTPSTTLKCVYKIFEGFDRGKFLKKNEQYLASLNDIDYVIENPSFQSNDKMFFGAKSIEELIDYLEDNPEYIYKTSVCFNKENSKTTDVYVAFRKIVVPSGYFHNERKSENNQKNKKRNMKIKKMDNDKVLSSLSDNIDDDTMNKLKKLSSAFSKVINDDKEEDNDSNDIVEENIIDSDIENVDDIIKDNDETVDNDDGVESEDIDDDNVEDSENDLDAKFGL